MLGYHAQLHNQFARDSHVVDFAAAMTDEVSVSGYVAIVVCRLVVDIKHAYGSILSEKLKGVVDSGSRQCGHFGQKVAVNSVHSRVSGMAE